MTLVKKNREWGGGGEGGNTSFDIFQCGLILFMCVVCMPSLSNRANNCPFSRYTQEHILVHMVRCTWYLLYIHYHLRDSSVRCFFCPLPILSCKQRWFRMWNSFGILQCMSIGVFHLQKNLHGVSPCTVKYNCSIRRQLCINKTSQKSP